MSSSASISSLTVTASPALTAAGKTITCGGGFAAYMCVAVGMNGIAIPNGIIASVTGTLVSGVTAGPVTLANALGAMASASAVSITDVNSAPAPWVTLTPATATLGPSQTQAFSAAVSGSSAGVVWTLSPAVGSITSSGIYTAPTAVTSSQTVAITATLSDGSAQSSATVTLQPTPQLTVSSVTASPASVIGGSNVSVTVALSAPAPNGGATVTLTASNLAFPGASVTVAAGTASQTVSLPTTTVTTTTPVTFTASYGSSSASSSLTITAPSTAKAVFVNSDTVTEGSWKGVYGADGFNVINDTISYPSYVAVTPAANSAYTWSGSVTDPRALQTASSPTNRIAACWYSSAVFSVDLQFGDTVPHTVALYFLDWNSAGRTQRVDLVDVNGSLLDTRTVSNFSQGQYLIWNLTGHVVVNITNTASAGNNAVLNGLFFGIPASATAPAAPTAASASITAVQGMAIAPVTMVGSGGAGAPYTFSATGLPTGLTMSASGTISGTPTASGTFNYTVTVKDSAGNTGTVNCSVAVNAAPTSTCVSITAVQGVAIAPVTMVGSGGVGAPYTFSATGLPTGLTMSASGTISGTPTASGTFNYTVTVKDSAGNAGTVNCSVTVNAAPTSTCVSITAVPGVAIAPVTMVGSGGVGAPYTFSATGLPTGLTMSGSGTISGTPSASGTFSYTVTVKDSAGNTGTVNCSVTVNAPTTATFVKADTTTQGSWMGVYGADGFNVINNTISYPSYVAVTPSGNSSYTWASSTTDPRALQEASSPINRIAAAWYGCTAFSVNLQFSDTAIHTVALYFLDWNAAGRTQRVDLLDANGNLLDTRILSNFSQGQYLVWNLTGNVVVRITNTASASNNAVLNGLFFGTSAATTTASSTATFVKADTVTEGSWKGAYGADGFNVINDTISYPSYVAVTPSANDAYTWAGSTTDPRALQTASSPTNRIAAAWYSSTVFSVNLQFNDTAAHTVALYFLDWNSAGRAQRIDLLDGNGNVLDTRTLSNFSQGQYLVWTLTGHVVVRITNTVSACNAVLNGIFFGKPPITAAPPTATFLRTDTANEGSWKGVYGADGFNVINDTISYPSYVAVTPSGNSAYTWAGSIGDVRALQKASSLTDRIAACWYASSSFTIDLVFQDAAIHQVGAYFLDWDVAGRNQRVDILDASGNVLNSQTITAFAAGKYLVWNVSGHVVIRLTSLSGPNAVVNGLFFR